MSDNKWVAMNRKRASNDSAPARIVELLGQVIELTKQRDEARAARDEEAQELKRLRKWFHEYMYAHDEDKDEDEATRDAWAAEEAVKVTRQRDEAVSEECRLRSSLLYEKRHTIKLLKDLFALESQLDDLAHAVLATAIDSTDADLVAMANRIVDGGKR